MKFKVIIGAITFAFLLTSIGYVLSLDIPEPDYHTNNAIECTEDPSNL